MRTIPLTQGQIARVDDADYERLAAFKWYTLRAPNGRYYAARTVYERTSAGRCSKRTVRMHREILGTDAPEVDHKDGDGLNNTRLNLRPATSSQNACNAGKRRDNTSGFKGVSLDRGRGRWRAQIRLPGRKIHLGYFETPEAAHAAYCVASARHHGLFARTG